MCRTGKEIKKLRRYFLDASLQSHIGSFFEIIKPSGPFNLHVSSPNLSIILVSEVTFYCQIDDHFVVMSMVLVLLLPSTAVKFQIKIFNTLKLFISEKVFEFPGKSQSTYMSDLDNEKN